jgi:hypothetical protein
LRLRTRLLLTLAGLCLATLAQADLLRHCAAPPALDAVQQDRLFRFAALVHATLDGSGQRLALVARAGLDLRRFGQRYSHAGISLRASPNTPWSVRQLYFDCDAGRPRLFDQGLPGFVLGGADPAEGHIVLWLLPEAAATALEAAALDKQQALRLLGDAYSANAHAGSTRYQNCNQWLAELLALAWGGVPAASTQPRADAQQWLRQQGYVPSRIQVGNPLLLLAGLLLPWLHTDDHPPEAVQRLQFDISLPESIEAFLRRQLPGVQRVEFCHDRQQMVVRLGWAPLGEGCRPAAGDQVLPFSPDGASAAVPAAAPAR